MSCYNPLLAVDLGFKVNKDGKKVRDLKLVDTRHKFFGKSFDEIKLHYGDSLICLPCGHCAGCAIDYSRMWASRIMLEASFHRQNCFITLTYDDFHLPSKLEKRPFQLFMKRLRKYFGFPIRYFACGEVGEGKGVREGFNPHYHAVLFGLDFPDKKLLKRSHSGMIIYTSGILQEIWPFGLVSIGNVTPESSQYVAKYSMKRKLTGEDKGEFVLMSRRPGIGAQGYDDDDYTTDKLYISGHRFKIPRYFDKVAEANGSFAYLVAKDNRIERAKTVTSKKYLYNVPLEENVMAIEQNNCFEKNIRKVRSL